MQYSDESELKLPLRLTILFMVEKFLQGFILRRDGSVNRSLANLCDYLLSVRPNRPRNGVHCQELLIDKFKGLGLRVYTPLSDPGEEGFPIVFYFHGGGFATMTPGLAYYDSFCERLCRVSNVVVISPNYRRSPEFRYPTAHEDCLSSITWIHENMHEISNSADFSSVFLVGDSAGGNLVHHVGSTILAAGLREEISTRPLAEGEKESVVCRGHIKGLVELFPFFGGECRTLSEIRLCNGPILTLDECDWYWNAYLPLGSTRDHHVANVFGPHDTCDYAKLDFPPIMVAIAGHDLLKDRQLSYVERLQQLGKRVSLEYYEVGFHCFHVFPQMEITSHLISRLHRFILDSS